MLIIILLSSCSLGKENPSGLNPNKMTEEDIYYTYGLEAPIDVYILIDSILMAENFNFDSLCLENIESTIIRIDIAVDSLTIIETIIRKSDYSATVDEVFKQAFMGLCRSLSLYDYSPYVQHYNFRMDLRKFCGRKNFSPTPPKDSTLITRPELNRILESTKKMLLPLSPPAN